MQYYLDIQFLSNNIPCLERKSIFPCQNNHFMPFPSSWFIYAEDVSLHMLPCNNTLSGGTGCVDNS